MIDATGIPSVMELGATLLDRTGTLLVLGVAPITAEIRISASRLNWQEQSILGSTSVNGRLPDAVRQLRESAGVLEKVVTDVVDLADFGSALTLVRSGNAMKVVVCPDPEVQW